MISFMRCKLDLCSAAKSIADIMQESRLRSEAISLFLHLYISVICCSVELAYMESIFDS